MMIEPPSGRHHVFSMQIFSDRSIDHTFKFPYYHQFKDVIEPIVNQVGDDVLTRSPVCIVNELKLFYCLMSQLTALCRSLALAI